MSTQVFPYLGPNVLTRGSMWSNTLQRSVSGKETAIAYWTYPMWQWSLNYNVIMSDDSEEYQSLVGFFNSRRGSFDTFLYEDLEDNEATAQYLGSSEGATTEFQLIRSLGDFIEPITAPKLVSAVYVDDVAQSASNYSVSSWGDDDPGVVTFNSAPTGDVTADFTFYFPCRFESDVLSLDNFFHQQWRGQGIAFHSVK